MFKINVVLYCQVMITTVYNNPNVLTQFGINGDCIILTDYSKGSQPMNKTESLNLIISKTKSVYVLT